MSHSGCRFVFRDVDQRTALVIDPDVVFWAIVSKRHLNSVVKREVLPIYKRFEEDLASEMHKFRFEVNLAAVYINPVDRCNADCAYCYIPSVLRRNGTQMNKNQLESVLTKIHEYFERKGYNSRTKPVIVFHGSEPLLIKDTILSAIETFQDFFHFGIQTNGLLLEEADVKFFKHNDVNVGLSLDSPKRETNDLLRRAMNGEGTYDKVVQAINWFDGYERLNVVSTVTNQNVEQLPELVSFLHRRKVSVVLLNPVRGTQKLAQSLKPDQEKLIRYFIATVERAIELSESSKNRIVIGNFANLVLGIIAPTARRLMCDITPCGGGRRFLTIAANGDMIPCGEFLGFKEFHGANIFDSSIDEAMESKAFRMVRSRVVEKIPECDVCAVRNICGAPCPAEVYATLGNMFHSPTYCKFYEALAKYAFRLIARNRIKYLFRGKAMENLEYVYNLTRRGERDYESR